MACQDATNTAPQAYTINPNAKPAQILTTNDSGSNWNTIYINPLGGPWDFNSINCVTDTTCLIWSNAGILHSTFDGGKSWSTSSYVSGTASLPSTIDTSKMKCPDVNNCFIMTQTSVTATKNGGRSWQTQIQASKAGFFRAISCPEPKICFLVGTDGLIKFTEDGGKNWQAQSAGISDEFNAISCSTATTCVAFASSFVSQKGKIGNIVSTSDKGKTWVVQQSNLINSISTIVCPSTNVCYAIGESKPDNNARRVFATNDSGTTWQIRSPSTDKLGEAISCPSNTNCFVTGRGGMIFSTNDEGVSWITQATGASRDFKDINCPTITRCFVSVSIL